MIKNKKTNRFLLLGGAPKCGTSYLFNILKDHPELSPSRNKETYYFMDADHTGINNRTNVHKNGLGGFLNYFDTTTEPNYFLEGTSHLIYQESMFEHLKKMGDVRVIFILRNPMERLVSTFDFTKNNLANIKNKKAYSFTNYVQALLSGRTEQLEEWLRDDNGYYVFKRELEYCNYYPYLRRWVEHFGRDRVRVIQFEEFIQDKTEGLQEILKWAGLSSDYYYQESPGAKNSTFSVKSGWLQHQSIKLARWIPGSALKGTLKKMYFAIQRQNYQKSKISQELKPKLHAYFEESNKKLQKDFGFNLEIWN